MSPEDLFAVVDDVLASIDYPSWPDGEDADSQETLMFFGPEEDEPAQWAIALGLDDDLSDTDALPIDVGIAAALLKDHMQCWLLARGWQVQVSVRKNHRHWRLVDCLSIADGGGDRLADSVEYPCGDDEMIVSCESVRAVLDGAQAPRAC